MTRWNLVVMVSGLALATACSRASEDAPRSAALSPAAAEGRQVYAANCTACHNQDPSQAGALGPPVAGSSAELLEAKVLHGEYPSDYLPKRASHAMVPLPHLAKEIPALAAYLASVSKGS